MSQSSEGVISFSADEAAALYSAMKRREDSLDSAARTALVKLEKYLYDALSIEDMERLVREATR